MKTAISSGLLSAFRRSVLSALAALLLPGIGHAQQTWKFDPTFQRTPLRQTSEFAIGVKTLSSGKVLMYSINGGVLSGANGQRIGPLVRIDGITGAIDPAWNPDPNLTAYGFLGVAEAPDGKVYYSTALVGEAAYTGSDPAINRLIRLNTDGSRDTSFNSPIFGYAARFVTVQPDGKILVCSGSINITGVPPPGSIVQTVRLNTDGSLDTSFQSPNFQFSASDPPASAGGNYFDLGVFGNPVVDSTTGKIYFCGTFRFVNGQPRKGIVRCNSDGTLDTSFVPTGLIGGNAQIIGRAMVVQAGGKVVLGGTSLRTAAGGATRYALLRFNNDGTLDPGFTLVPTTNSTGGQLFPGYFGPRDIHALPDGKILTSDVRVLRFLADGTMDPSFPPLDYTSPYFTNTGQVGSFRFDVNPSTGVAYLENPGPLYARLGGVAVGNITKLNPDRTIDTGFNPPVVESENFAPEVQIAASGDVYVSGFHNAFGNAANATITRLLPDGTRDPSYSLDTLPFPDKQAAGFALLPDGAAYAIYYSGSFTGGYQFSNLVRLLPNGALDTNFRPSSALQTAFAINAYDGSDIAKSSLGQISAAPMGRAYLFPEGPQATVNGNGNLKPTRVNPDGTEDTSVPALGFPVGEVVRDPTTQQITAGSAGYLHRLAQTADGGFLVLASVAPFPTSNGNPYNFKLIKLRADGSQDPTFVSPSLTSTGLASLSFPSLFDPVTGSVAQPFEGFYIAPTFPVSSALVLPDGSIVLAGEFRQTGQPTVYTLAKLSSTGAFTLFSPPVPGPENRARPSRPALITKVRVAPGGKIWVLGRFDTIGGAAAPGVARLNPDGTLDTSFGVSDVEYYDSFGDAADVVFADGSTAYLVGTFRKTGEPKPFAITRILGPPAIISPLTATGIVGQQLTYQFLTSGATSLGVTNLPPGLTFNATLAAITGTLSAAGTFQLNLSAANAVGTTNATLTITIQPPPPSGPIITSGTSATGRVGRPFSFQVTTTGGSPATRLSAAPLPPGLSIDAVTGLISGTPTTEGSLAVVLTATDSNLSTTSVLQLTFTADPAVPVIVSSNTASVAPGQAFSYTISAPSSADPSDVTVYTLIGTLPQGLTFDDKTGTISGVFTGNPLRDGPRPDWETLSGGIVTNVQLFATNSQGTSTLPLLFTLAPVGTVNISTRLAVGSGDNVLIAGFIITGNAPKQVIIRAISSSLTANGEPLPGALQDPTLELHDGTGTLGSNDNWRDSQEDEIIGTTIPPTDDRESAILATLIPGNYTAVVSGHDNSTGIAVVEVYDLGTASLDGASKARLAQISTRGTVLTDDDVMIGGFIISAAPSKVLVRAIGPELNGVVRDPLQDTTLELRDASGSLIHFNDDWRTTQEQQIIDTTVPPADNRESAIVATLNPGNYTAIVRGKENSTGVALVEVYGLQ